MNVKTDQHQEEFAAPNAKPEQHISALTDKIGQQQPDVNTLILKREQQIVELRQEIPQEVQRKVLPSQQQLEMLEEQLGKVERRPLTLISQTSDGTGQ